MKTSEPPPNEEIIPESPFIHTTYDGIEKEEVDLSGTVFITAELEKIFDIINEFHEDTQRVIYEKLEEMNDNPKLVAFVIAESFNTKNKKDVYNILFKYKGHPTLIYSTNENLLAQFIEDNTNIPKELIHDNFNYLKNQDDEGETERET